MMMAPVRAVGAFVLVAFMGLPLVAADGNEYENAGVKHPQMVKEFVDQLKKAVADQDAKTLSCMVFYPLDV
jgi:ABC-type sugar transport system substrate-binding protein